MSKLISSLSVLLCAVALTAPLALAHDESSATPVCAAYKYVGNNVSLKFHRPSCPFARSMRLTRIELFHYRAQAIAAGMKPCRYCLPPYWLKVNGVLLKGEQEPLDPPP